jgi:DNA-directed RNA polymerase subunit alpha
VSYLTTTSTEDNDVPIEALDLSVRSYNRLKRNSIATVRQLLAMKRSELLGIRNFHQENYEEVRDQLVAHGFMHSAHPIGPFIEDDEEQE